MHRSTPPCSRSSPLPSSSRRRRGPSETATRRERVTDSRQPQGLTNMTIQTHNALVEPSSLAESILEHIADAVIYADGTGTIRRWNAAAADLFGHGSEEALGQSLDLIIPERLRPAHWRGFGAAVTSGALKLSGRPTVTRALHRTGRRL